MISVSLCIAYLFIIECYIFRNIRFRNNKVQDLNSTLSQPFNTADQIGSYIRNYLKELSVVHIINTVISTEYPQFFLYSVED